MTRANDVSEVAPWLKPLTPDARAAVLEHVQAAPPLTQRQRERLRLLFQARKETT